MNMFLLVEGFGKEIILSAIVHVADAGYFSIRAYGRYRVRQLLFSGHIVQPSWIFNDLITCI